MRTQVCIIGAGPSGLLLAQLLYLQGIDCIMLESRTPAYVLAWIRAGLLERITVEMLRTARCAERLNREGLVHRGVELAFGDQRLRIDFEALVDSHMTVYGQTELTRDLMEKHRDEDNLIIFEAAGVRPFDFDTERPGVSYQSNGRTETIRCDFIAGCDGYHGICRAGVPGSATKLFERQYPFGWLGVLSETKPVSDELIYSNSHRGFALCSMRSMTRSRYYVQCPLSDRVEAWPDQRFWDELRRRLPESVAQSLITGASIEKSIAGLRSFVAEPMQFGKLFLVGDAAHIVPPTGAKGLNLAASDVYYLSRALIAHYQDKDKEGLALYSKRALARVWQAERFSWWMTNLLHLFEHEEEAFRRKMQLAEFAYLHDSRIAQTSFAENYVGLPT